jgi:CubicO group peptidase (beta-lactamase class C family)
VIASWGDQKVKYALRSDTKSLGSILLGLAIDEGRLALGDRAVDRLSGFGTPPSSNVNTGWLPKIMVLQLATHTAGFDAGGGDYLPLVFAPGASSSSATPTTPWPGSACSWPAAANGRRRRSCPSPMSTGPAARLWP